MTESFTESKFDVEYVSTVKSTTQQVRVFKSNQIFGRKRPKINLLEKTIEYKANEQGMKDLNEIWK